MKKKKLLYYIVVFTFLLIFVNNNTILAEEIEIVNEETTKDIDEELLETQKQEILTMIDECIESMKVQLAEIESKEKKVKEQKEFDTYPAIRLNVDAPLFGFMSMTDNRLKIKKDVSTVDVANGYSIRDVVNQKTIKLPDFTIGSIVVTTKELKIDENMTYEEASIALLKIMQYMSQLDSTEEFLDFQINRTFKGYIDKDKSDKLNDIKTRNDNITTSLISLDEKITYLHIMKYDEKILNDINTEFDEISKKNKEISTSAKDMLISNDNLTTLQKDVVELEVKLIELGIKVDKEYNIAVTSYDEEKMLTTIKSELEEKRNYLKKYIDNSVYTKTIAKEEKSEKKDSNETNSNVEVITRYEVTSKNTLEYLDTAISQIDEKITKYIPKEEEKETEKEVENETSENSNEEESLNQEVINKGEVTQVEVKELSKAEKKELVDEVYKIYVDFLSRENKFYLDNTNFLLNDTTNKISDLTGKTNGYVLSYTNYMYIELPEKLKEYINENNMSSKRELKKLTKSLKEELVTIVDVNVKVDTLYDEMIEEELRS